MRGRAPLKGKAPFRDRAPLGVGPLPTLKSDTESLSNKSAFVRLQVVFFNFSFQLTAISERFELESSDWAHFLRLFKLLPGAELLNESAPNAVTGAECFRAEIAPDSEF